MLLVSWTLVSMAALCVVRLGDSEGDDSPRIDFHQLSCPFGSACAEGQPHGRGPDELSGRAGGRRAGTSISATSSATGCTA